MGFLRRRTLLEGVQVPLRSRPERVPPGASGPMASGLSRAPLFYCTLVQVACAGVIASLCCRGVCSGSRGSHKERDLMSKFPATVLAVMLYAAPAFASDESDVMTKVRQFIDAWDNN